MSQLYAAIATDHITPTSDGQYLYGNTIPITAAPASRYSTLNVSKFGSWVGL